MAGEQRIKRINIIITARLWQIVEDLCVDSPCILDHRGFCQKHNWNSDEPCPMKRIRDLKKWINKV